MNPKNSKSYIERLTWVDFRSGWTLILGATAPTVVSGNSRKNGFSARAYPPRVAAATPIN